MSDPIFLVVITVVSYINCFDSEFVFDDISAIVNNRYIRTNETTLLSVFGTDYWGTDITSEHSHKSYRPLTVITFRLNYLLNGVEPYGYHVLNVLLHLSVVLLYHKFCLKLVDNRRIALIASILFAIHPIKTEAVTGVVGRAELLSTLFFLFSLMSYINQNYLRFLIGVICALLSKEQGVTVLAVCLTYEFSKCFDRSAKERSSLKRFSFLCLILIIIGSILMTLRIQIMGGKYNLPVFTKFDNPATFEPFPTRHLTYNFLLPLNTFLMLYPYNLCCDWTMKSIALIHDFWDTRNLWTLIFYSILITLVIRSLIDLFRFGNNRLVIILSLIIFPFIPASNLFFPVGFVIAERTLYIPSTGFSLLLAIGWQTIERRYSNNSKLKKFLLIVFCFTIALFCLKTQLRNNEWKSELSLFSSAIKVNQNNAKLYNNIGHHYERHKDYDKALEYFTIASVQQSDDLGSHINIARTLINLGEHQKAEQLLWKIKPKVKLSAINKRIIPHYLNLWINLANILVRNKTRLSEAENLYKELIGMRSDFVEAYINLGDILIRQSKHWEAIKIYQKGLSMAQMNRRADLYFNLGVVYSMILKKSVLNETKHSEFLLLIADYFMNSTLINSNHKESIVNLAILLQQHESVLRPYRQLLIDKMKAYSGVDQELIYFNLALLLSDSGDNHSAIHYLKKTIELKNDFRSALFNLALILIENHNYIEAEHYLIQLLNFHPNHTKSLLLIGNLYTNQFKDWDRAERSYLEVLKHNQTNIEAFHNLCVVYHKRNKTEEANDCFKRFNSNQKIVNKSTEE